MFEIFTMQINTIEQLNEIDLKYHSNSILEKLPWAFGVPYNELYGPEFKKSLFIRIEKPKTFIIQKDVWINIAYNYLKERIDMRKVMSLSCSKDMNLNVLYSGDINMDMFNDIDIYMQKMFCAELESQGFSVSNNIHETGSFDTIENKHSYKPMDERENEIISSDENKNQINENSVNKKEINEGNLKIESVNENITDDLIIENKNDSLNEEIKDTVNIKDNFKQKNIKDNKNDISESEDKVPEISDEENINELLKNNPSLLNKLKDFLLTNDKENELVNKDNIKNITNNDNSEIEENINNVNKNTEISINDEFKNNEESEDNIISSVKENIEENNLIDNKNNNDVDEFENKLQAIYSKIETNNLDLNNINDNEIELEKLKEDIDKKIINELNDLNDNDIDNITNNSLPTDEISLLLNKKISDNNSKIEPSKILSDDINNDNIKLNNNKNNTQINKSNDENVPFLNRLINNHKNYISRNKRTNKDDNEIIYNTIKRHTYMLTSITQNDFDDIFSSIMKYFTTIEKLKFIRLQRGEVEKTDFEDDVKLYIKKTYTNVNENDTKMLTDRVLNAACDLYILDDLINDEKISDIRIISWNKIRVKIYGVNYTADVSFIDENDYETFVNGIAIRNNINLEYGLATFTDKKSSKNAILRFNITTHQTNSSGTPYVHIAKTDRKKKGFDELIKEEMLNPVIADYLIDKIKNGKGIMVAGQSRSGKTVLTNAIIDYIPMDSTATIIQENEELFSNVHPDIMCEHIGWVVPTKGRPRFYGLEELVRNALLTNTEYIIVGELKGPETRDFITACATSHKCIATIHASSAKDVPFRMADLIKYGSDYTIAECLRMIKDMGIIVFMSHYKVQEIVEITGYDEEKQCLKLKTVYFNNVPQPVTLDKVI